MQQRIKATGEDAYFAASNSRYGFRSYYEPLFRGQLEQLFCIKGGPGTGKSTLMREVAREGERRGMRVEYYYCSSDADSLDAVLLFGERKSVGLIDATAPHVFEPSLPGVREHVVDLGQFWDATQLGASGEEIALLNRQKSEGFRAAYRCLAGVGELSDILQERVGTCLDTEKMRRSCARLLRDTPQDRGTAPRIGLCRSIGMGGFVQLDTYWQRAQRLCLISDYHDSAYALTASLAHSARKMGMRCRMSYHPVLANCVDALLLEDTGTAVVVCTREQAEALQKQLPHARTLDMRRMLGQGDVRRVREQLRRADRLRKGLLDEAARCMKGVADAHFALESIYISAMDFAAKERYTKALCERVFQ